MKSTRDSESKDEIIKESLNVNGVAFTHADIHKVVASFYGKVEQDDLLKTPFQSVQDWPEHIDRLTHFWWLRFGGKAYMFTHYHPVAKHYYAGFNEHFLRRWLQLFQQTLKEHLTEPQAQLWSVLSNKMGYNLNLRNEMFKKAQEEK